MKACVDVAGLQQGALLLVRQPRRVARRVRQRGGIGELVDRVDDLPGLTALQHREHDLLVLGGELAGALGDGGLLDEVDLDPQRRPGPGGPGADVRALLAAQHRDVLGLPGHAPDLHDRRDDTVRRVAIVEPRGDEELAALARAAGVNGGLGGVVERDGHDHAG